MEACVLQKILLSSRKMKSQSFAKHLQAKMISEMQCLTLATLALYEWIFLIAARLTIHVVNMGRHFSDLKEV